MDFDYYLRLSAAGFKFSFLPQTLAAFRWHDSNTSTQFADRRYQERVQIQREHLARIGRPALGREWLLSVLKRVYQAKRALRCAVTRHG